MKKLHNQAVCIFLVFLIVMSPIRAEEKKEFDANDPETWDYTKPEVYTLISPDNPNFDWARADYNQVQWNRVTNFEKVRVADIPVSAYPQIDFNRIPPARYDQVKWNSASADKIRQITSPNLDSLIATLSSPANRAQLIKLSAAQLQDKTRLSAIGDLKDVSIGELNTALRNMHSLKPIVFTVTPGTRYENGKLINPTFPEGLDLESLKNDDKIIMVSAVTNPSAANTNGFLICRSGQEECTVITASAIGAIIGITANADGSTTILGTNENFNIRSGEVAAVLDTEGNAVFTAKDGTKFLFRGIEFTASGIEGKETKFSVKENEIEITGPCKAVSGNLNGNVQAGGWLKVKVGATSDDLIVSGSKATMTVFKDIYSSDLTDFSCTYSSRQLNTFTLGQGSWAEMRGHPRLTNNDVAPAVYYTQNSPEGKRVMGIWHAGAIIATLNEEQADAENLKSEEEVLSYVAKRTAELDARIAQKQAQFDSETNEIQKARLTKEIAELTIHRDDLRKITSRTELQNFISSSIAGMEAQVQTVASGLKNAGMIEWQESDEKYTSGIIPSRMAIIPGKSSYGTKEDILSFSGAQSGVYSVYSPPEYSGESGRTGSVKKNGVVYFVPGKQELTGDFGTVLAKTELGEITIVMGRDYKGDTYSKVSRDSAVRNKIANMGILVVGPSSKTPQTSIIALDADGIHAIARLIGDSKTEVPTSPSAIKVITDAFARVRAIAIGVLQVAGMEFEDAIKKLSDKFATDIEEIKSFIMQNRNAWTEAQIETFIEINTLKVDKKEAELIVLTKETLDPQMRAYAMQSLINLYDSSGQSEKATNQLAQWLTEDPKNKELVDKISEARKAAAASQQAAGLTGKEDIPQLLDIANKNPSLEVYTRLSEMYQINGDAANAQRYAELAQAEFTKKLETARFNMQAAGFINVFDFSEKAVNVYERVAASALVNKDYSRTEDSSRFMLSLDTRNLGGQNLLSSALINQNKLQENIDAWKEFKSSNQDVESLKSTASVALVSAYAQAKQYSEAGKEYDELQASAATEEQKQQARTDYIFLLNKQASESAAANNAAEAAEAARRLEVVIGTEPKTTVEKFYLAQARTLLNEDAKSLWEDLAKLTGKSQAETTIAAIAQNALAQIKAREEFEQRQQDLASGDMKKKFAEESFAGQQKVVDAQKTLDAAKAELQRWELLSSSGRGRAEQGISASEVQSNIISARQKLQEAEQALSQAQSNFAASVGAVRSQIISAAQSDFAMGGLNLFISKQSSADSSLTSARAFLETKTKELAAARSSGDTAKIKEAEDSLINARSELEYAQLISSAAQAVLPVQITRAGSQALSIAQQIASNPERKAELQPQLDSLNTALLSLRPATAALLNADLQKAADAGTTPGIIYGSNYESADANLQRQQQAAAQYSERLAQAARAQSLAQAAVLLSEGNSPERVASILEERAKQQLGTQRDIIVSGLTKVKEIESSFGFTRDYNSQYGINTQIIQASAAISAAVEQAGVAALIKYQNNPERANELVSGVQSLAANARQIARLSERAQASFSEGLSKGESTATTSAFLAGLDASFYRDLTKKYYEVYGEATGNKDKAYRDYVTSERASIDTSINEAKLRNENTPLLAQVLAGNLPQQSPSPSLFSFIPGAQAIDSLRFIENSRLSSSGNDAHERNLLESRFELQRDLEQRLGTVTDPLVWAELTALDIQMRKQNAGEAVIQALSGRWTQRGIVKSMNIIEGNYDALANSIASESSANGRAGRIQSALGEFQQAFEGTDYNSLTPQQRDERLKKLSPRALSMLKEEGVVTISAEGTLAFAARPPNLGVTTFNSEYQFEKSWLDDIFNPEYLAKETAITLAGGFATKPFTAAIQAAKSAGRIGTIGAAAAEIATSAAIFQLTTTPIRVVLGESTVDQMFSAESYARSVLMFGTMRGVGSVFESVAGAEFARTTIGKLAQSTVEATVIASIDAGQQYLTTGEVNWDQSAQRFTDSLLTDFTLHSVGVFDRTPPEIVRDATAPRSPEQIKHDTSIETDPAKLRVLEAESRVADAQAERISYEESLKAKNIDADGGARPLTSEQAATYHDLRAADLEARIKFAEAQAAQGTLPATDAQKIIDSLIFERSQAAVQRDTVRLAEIEGNTPEANAARIQLQDSILRAQQDAVSARQRSLDTEETPENAQQRAVIDYERARLDLESLKLEQQKLAAERMQTIDPDVHSDVEARNIDLEKQIKQQQEQLANAATALENANYNLMTPAQRADVDNIRRLNSEVDIAEARAAQLSAELESARAAGRTDDALAARAVEAAEAAAAARTRVIDAAEETGRLTPEQLSAARTAVDLATRERQRAAESIMSEPPADPLRQSVDEIDAAQKQISDAENTARTEQKSSLESLVENNVQRQPAPQATSAEIADAKQKAEGVLGKTIDIDQVEAVARAHNIEPERALGDIDPVTGLYLPNSDPNLRFTSEGIAQKARILKEAGFKTLSEGLAEAGFETFSDAVTASRALPENRGLTESQLEAKVRAQYDEIYALMGNGVVGRKRLSGGSGGDGTETQLFSPEVVQAKKAALEKIVASGTIPDLLKGMDLEEVARRQTASETAEMFRSRLISESAAEGISTDSTEFRSRTQKVEDTIKQVEVAERATELKTRSTVNLERVIAETDITPLVQQGAESVESITNQVLRLDIAAATIVAQSEAGSAAARNLIDVLDDYKLAVETVTESIQEGKTPDTASMQTLAAQRTELERAITEAYSGAVRDVSGAYKSEYAALAVTDFVKADSQRAADPNAVVSTITFRGLEELRASLPKEQADALSRRITGIISDSAQANNLPIGLSASSDSIMILSGQTADSLPKVISDVQQKLNVLFNEYAVSGRGSVSASIVTDLENPISKQSLQTDSASALSRAELLRAYGQDIISGDDFERVSSGDRAQMLTYSDLRNNEVQLIRPLGQGAVGTVYLGVYNGETVVIKTVIEGGDLDQSRDTLRVEVDTAGGLSHQNLLRLKGESVTTGRTPFAIQEYIPGENLQDYSTAKKRSATIQEISNLLYPVADAVQHMHDSGLVHRDIKPANVMVSPEGPKLIDFGIATQSNKEFNPSGSAAYDAPEALIRNPNFAGYSSEYYRQTGITPEQIQSASAESRDVFQLATTIYETFANTPPLGLIDKLTGKAPDTQPLRNAGVPSELESIILRGLSYNPAERPSAAEFRDALAKYATPEIKPGAKIGTDAYLTDAGIQMRSRFEIVRELGRGGMGVNFVAKDTITGQEVVVKTLLPGATESDRILFQREAEALAQVNRPDEFDTPAPQLIEYDMTGRPYIVQEYIPGRNVEAAMPPGSKPSLSRALDIVEGEVTAVQALHEKGIVHRDLKGTNFMLTPSGEVKVIDFGLSGVDMQYRIDQRARGSAGTPVYIAPEVIDPSLKPSSLASDAPSDVYSLGALIYEQITGQLPIPIEEIPGPDTGKTQRAIDEHYKKKLDPSTQITPLSSLNSHVSPEFSQVIMQSLARNPGERPTIEQLRTAIVQEKINQQAREASARNLRAAIGVSPGGLLARLNKPREPTPVSP